MFSSDLALYVALGFAAQLVDGALGMAYGLLCTSALLATGAPPALASASVHAAEVVTTGLAGGSHLWHRNVDWRLFRRLAPAGVAGGALGAWVLTELPVATVKVVAVRTISRGRREPTIRASRNRMWSAPWRRCSAPTRNHDQNHSGQDWCVLKERCSASRIAVPELRSRSKLTIVLVSVT